MKMMPRPPALGDIHWTRVGGITVHSVLMEQDGPRTGQNFVLVHGLGMSSRYMMPTARLLSPHGDVHVPDLPGFGKSDKPSRTLSIHALADALNEWLEARQIGHPVLIGNSLGGQVIADYAARYPQRLNCAVLVAPTIDPEARQISTQVIRLLRDLPREPVELYWIGLRDYFRAGWETIFETLRFAVEHSVSESLSRIRRPVLLVRGGRDPIIPQSWMETAVQLPSSAELVVVPHAAHAVNFNTPGVLVGEVLAFLARHASNPSPPGFGPPPEA
ncbi:MAG: alpha/beta hydrolase [Verrucomicrobiota bacterium]